MSAADTHHQLVEVYGTYVMDDKVDSNIHRLTLQHKASDNCLPDGTVQRIMMDVLYYCNAGMHKSQYQITVVTKFCRVACNICGSSVWNFLHVTFLVCRILRGC